MNNVTRRFLWVSAYAIAMALLEAVVVIYLRGLLQISQDHVALGSYLRTEVAREVATVVMLVVVGRLAGRSGGERWAYGLFAFGLWDIAYYGWLKVSIDWPPTLMNWDVLFLIPLRWWGPVLSPMLIAMVICATTVLAVRRLEQGRPLAITPARVAGALLGGVLALYAFMADSLQALLAGRADWDTLRPEAFNWPLFLVALTLMAVPSLLATWPLGITRSRTALQESPSAREKEVLSRTEYEESLQGFLVFRRTL